MNDRFDRVKYSVLIAGEKLELDELDRLLKKGIKVIWFGNAREKEQIKQHFSQFLDKRHICSYLNRNNVKLVLIDGQDAKKEDSKLQSLAHGDENFNLEQYYVEHAPIDTTMIVEAGAGSGKTHVMIDRIMFLMHMCEDFSFSDVAMVTFTNKSTDEMRHRLIAAMRTKYSLTHDTKYLRGIEELSLLQISTIHSFFRSIIIEIGPMLGYGTDMQLRSYIQEKKDILRELLDKQYGTKTKRVTDVIGLPIHDIVELAIQYWEKLDNNGISEKEIKELDWGNAEDTAKTIQNTLKKIFDEVDEKYNETKYRNNAISMKDIIHELSRVVEREDLPQYISHKFRYIFVDEFQDSDNVQIYTIALLQKLYGGYLFVVGDIKQSIYRFRGATDSAFLKLLECLDEDDKDKVVQESLTKNYRTSKSIMDELDTIFAEWGNKHLGLLSYENKDRLIPQKTEKGIYKQIRIRSNSDRKKAFLECVRKIQKESKYKEIVCLTRKNSELEKIKAWCEEAKIVCLIKEQGAFYTSQPVLDFCALVEAFYYEEKPEYLYNYICSSYCASFFDPDAIEGSSGDDSITFQNDVIERLRPYIDQKMWEHYKNEFKNRPVMSVIRNMIGELKPVENYGVRRKAILLGKRYPEEKATEQALIDSEVYGANLRKLLQILMDQYSGEFSSLGDICEFIRIKILTDQTEELADVKLDQGEGCIKGMTVHGSKGLEFENVLIPFMNDPFNQDFRSEIIISKDRKKIGWIYRGRGEEVIQNANYDEIIENEQNEVAKEETRLLYVAMTRCKYGLYVFPIRLSAKNDRPQTWADLLPEES
ncbi:MAG: UvrD-helicase domain-containing protein [Lachnospiraceae bacterium]|nr:UvrD-helicase domain-containing protein [Lachnospiraceae bacterium]